MTNRQVVGAIVTGICVLTWFAFIQRPTAGRLRAALRSTLPLL